MRGELHDEMMDDRSMVQEDIRRRLDERGVAWRETLGGGTGWQDANGDDVVTLHAAAGLVQIRAWLTPEQAVEVTLGCGPEARE